MRLLFQEQNKRKMFNSKKQKQKPQKGKKALCFYYTSVPKEGNTNAWPSPWKGEKFNKNKRQVYDSVASFATLNCIYIFPAFLSLGLR